MAAGGSERVSRPIARNEGLIVESVDGELLVYDTERNRAHCLEPRAAAVWRACDGTRTIGEIAAAAGIETELARQALVQLGEAHLLKAPPRRKPTRRQMLAVAAVPFVVSILAPAAAQAASCIAFFQPCTPNGKPCCPVNGNPGRCASFGRFGNFCV